MSTDGRDESESAAPVPSDAEQRSIVRIAESVEVRIGQPLWVQWFDIALFHDAEARSARADLVACFHHGASPAPDMTREMVAGLVTVSASAHALDALYGQLANDVVRRGGPKNGTRREAYIREMLKHRFSNVGARDQRWVDEFRWLFELRDAVVHARFELAPVVPHPSGVGHSGKVAADYAAESGSRALDLLVEVLEVCVNSAKPADLEAVKWAHDYAPGIQELLTRLRVSREAHPLVREE